MVNKRAIEFIVEEIWAEHNEDERGLIDREEAMAFVRESIG